MIINSKFQLENISFQKNTLILNYLSILIIIKFLNYHIIYKIMDFKT